jgi:hypothetical protein
MPFSPPSAGLVICASQFPVDVIGVWTLQPSCRNDAPQKYPGDENISPKKLNSRGYRNLITEYQVYKGFICRTTQGIAALILIFLAVQQYFLPAF